jgi:hypothetical protein
VQIPVPDPSPQIGLPDFINDVPLPSQRGVHLIHGSRRAGIWIRQYVSAHQNPQTLNPMKNPD